MATPEEITNPLIAALQSRIAEAEAPVAELTPEEQEEARAASEQSALARKYFSRDIISEARKMAEDELPKNRFLRALVGMGEGAARYYNPKTFQSREARAFDRLEKDFQRRGPVLQRDLAAYESTAARNEQKRLDRQARLKIADDRDKADAQKTLLKIAQWAGDDPERKAQVELLLKRKELTEGNITAKKLENAYMELNGAKMPTATGAMTESALQRYNPEAYAALLKDRKAKGLEKLLFGTVRDIFKGAIPQETVSSTSGRTGISNIGGVPMEVTYPGQTTVRRRGGAISPQGQAIVNLLLGGNSPGGGVANAPGILGGSAAALGLSTMPPAGAERGAESEALPPNLEKLTKLTREQLREKWLSKEITAQQLTQIMNRKGASGEATPGSTSSAAAPSPGAPVAQRPAAKTATTIPSRAELAQVAAGSGVGVPTTAALNSGGKLKMREITGVAGKPLSTAKEQDTRLGIDLLGSIDESIDILTNTDPKVRAQMEKEMRPTADGLAGYVPILRDELPKWRSVDMARWSRTTDPTKQQAYQKYKQLVASNAKAQWETAIRASGKAINKGEAAFINQILVSLGGDQNNQFIEDTPETAMSKLVRQKLALGALNAKMDAVKKGLISEEAAGNIDLSKDMRSAAERIMAKYKKGEKITAEEFQPEVNYPAFTKVVGERGTPATSVDDKQSKWEAAYQEALKKAGVIK